MMEERTQKHRSGYGLASCLIFLFTLLLWILLSALDPYLIQLSATAQRWISIAALVLPSVVGALIGLAGMLKPQQNRILAVIGLVLNALQTLHFTFVLMFAG